MNKTVTLDQVEQWLGSENTLEQAIEIIAQVANGGYTPEELNKNIVEYDK